ncbi:MAG: type I-C CRISPR-associated protein Cas7/Csd2 [Tissierellia bacterium]|nr:type I-C CRISPR-associated protein Cas7/Csd2 [Tissierellia bacterium]
MTAFEKKIDFIVTVEVKDANPNGDPLNGNMPRDDINGYGEISDVCIKRKIRNRLQDMGESIFVQSNDRIDDGFRSLERRFDSHFDKKKDDDESVYVTSCEKWTDVRAFGQVMTYQKRSIGIRGPVSITLAKSLSPITIQSMQITRSTNGMEAEVGKGRSSDTMGMKQYVDYGVYVIKGSINVFFAEKTGFTFEDSELIKEALRTLFINDASSARPEGSMQVKELFWFKHPSKLGVTSTAKIFELLTFEEPSFEKGVFEYEDYKIALDEEKLLEFKSEGLELEVIEGV